MFGWLGRRRARLVARQRKFDLDQRVVGLAYQRHGRLRLEDVASALQVSRGEASLTTRV